jgi:hypothetical protein
MRQIRNLTFLVVLVACLFKASPAVNALPQCTPTGANSGTCVGFHDPDNDPSWCWNNGYDICYGFCMDLTETPPDYVYCRLVEGQNYEVDCTCQ